LIAKAITFSGGLYLAKEKAFEKGEKLSDLKMILKKYILRR
jgi:hypothetical protein